jgi:hypothetical protein
LIFGYVRWHGLLGVRPACRGFLSDTSTRARSTAALPPQVHVPRIFGGQGRGINDADVRKACRVISLISLDTKNEGRDLPPIHDAVPSSYPKGIPLEAGSPFSSRGVS